MKTCPYCFEEVRDQAVKCKHCHEFLDAEAARKITIRKTATPEKILYPQLHPSYKTYLGHLLLAVPLSLVGVGLFYLLWIYIDRRFTKYRITAKRIMTRKGIFHRKTNEVLINDIRSLYLRRSFWGLVFGYGTILIGTSGTGAIEITLKGINQPEKLKETIQKYNRI